MVIPHPHLEEGEAHERAVEADAARPQHGPAVEDVGRGERAAAVAGGLALGEAQQVRVLTGGEWRWHSLGVKSTVLPRGSTCSYTCTQKRTCGRPMLTLLLRPDRVQILCHMSLHPSRSAARDSKWLLSIQWSSWLWCW